MIIKTFGKQLNLFFQENKLVLFECEIIISEDKAVADTIYTFFAHAVEELNIIGYQLEN